MAVCLPKNICVVARTHKLLDDYIAHFTSSGIRCYEIKGNKADDRGLSGSVLPRCTELRDWNSSMYLL